MKLEDKYKFYHKLGEGGFGQVYLVREIIKKGLFKDTLGTKLYALKIYKKTDNRIYEREVSILKRVKKDKHFVKIIKKHKQCTYKGRIVNAILLEYIDGHTLQEYISMTSIGKVDFENLTYQLLRLINKVHSFGIIHRDIKFSNIMVHNGKIKLIDFGLACFLNTKKKFVCDGTVGTKSYMAPEVKERTVVDWEKSDLYSIGIVLKKIIKHTNIILPDYLLFVVENMVINDYKKRLNIPSLIKVIKTKNINARVKDDKNLIKLCENKITLPMTGRLYFHEEDEKLYCMTTKDVILSTEMKLNKFTENNLSLSDQIKMKKWLDSIMY